MNSEKKSIDGLIIRRPESQRRTVGFDTQPKRRQTPKNTPKSSPKNAASLAATPARRKNSPKAAAKDLDETLAVLEAKRRAAAEDFLKPVETFDLDLTTDDLKKAKKAKKGKKHKKMSKKRKALIIIGAIVVALVAILLIWGEAIIAKLTGGNSNIFDAISTLVSEDVPLKTDKNGRSNILIFGTSGYDMEGSEGETAHDGAQLTDSIMILSLDQNTKDVAMMSLPRDLKVSGACSAGKINEIYWCNNPDGTNETAGATALQETVSEITGLEFQYYAHVDWAALVQLVDAVGGITVTLDENIADPWTNTYIDAGVPTTLNGEQALGLARARHGTEGGDFSRGNSQQKIIIALAEKVLNSNIGLTEALNIVNILGDNLRTNFNTDEIKTLAHLVSGTDLASMRQVPLVDYETNTYYVTTATIGGISYVVPSAGVGNYSDIQKYVAQMFSSDPVVREAPSILVLNGTGTAGVASVEKTKLVSAGFADIDIDDAPAGTYPAYTLYALNPEKTGSKAALESRYKVTALDATTLPAGISAAYDFVLIIGQDPNATAQ